MISPDTKRRILDIFKHNAQVVSQTVTIRRWLLPGAIAGIFLALVFGAMSAPLTGAFFGFCAITIGVVSFFSKDPLEKTIEKAKELELPCPLCHRSINLVAPWICGNCKNEHNKDNEEPLAIPFVHCVHSACSHREQTAFQCPYCHHHIVLDQSRYIADRSYEHPHRYVARYSGDTSAAIPNRPKAASTSSAFDDEGSVFDD